MENLDGKEKMNIVLPKREKVTRDEVRRQLKKANKELQKLNRKIREELENRY